ncbi:MAG: SLC13 family permease [Qingshengfaniella sp.]
MSSELAILFSLFLAVFILLLWGRLRYDLVAFGALMIAVLTGTVATDAAFSGFGHPATIIVALVLIISAGLTRSGAVFLITRTLIDTGRAVSAHIAIMGTVGAVLSAFMNNVAALALLMPVDLQTARKAGRAAGATLMPLSFATILGGMVTLIGTPPNIIIASIRQEHLSTPYRMFDFAPVGLCVAAAGLAYVALIGWRLIPGTNAGQTPREPFRDVADYVSEMTVGEGSDLIGKRLTDLRDAAETADVVVLGLVRQGRWLRGDRARAEIEAGDGLVVEGLPAGLDEFRVDQKLELTENGADSADMDLIEVVVPEDARVVGRSATGIGMSWSRRTILLGISRRGQRITKQVRRTEILAGDQLLLLVPRDQREAVVTWLGALPLADRGLSVIQDHKTWLAIGTFAAAVAAASFGLVYLPVALGCVCVLYVLARIVPVTEVYDQIEWPVVILLGSMIPLGQALDEAGGTALIAQSLLSITDGLPAWAVLGLLMVVTMTLSDVLNNTATTIVAAPVAISMADGLGVSADPFLMAVAVAASCAFLTPIGHKNNTLVLGPGGYRFGDYWQMGLPLEVIVLLVSIPSILVFWPL